MCLWKHAWNLSILNLHYELISLHIISAISSQEESQSTPALIHIPETSSGGELEGGCMSAGMSSARGSEGGTAEGLLHSVPENNLRESCTRLSISLEENGLYKVSSVHYFFLASIHCKAQLKTVLVFVTVENFCT